MNKNLPKISNYGRYDSDNYGAHTLKVDMGVFDLYYSYDTIVAFYSHKTGLVVSKNVWGVTTGKHLNWIEDNKKVRIEYSEFEKQLEEMLDNYLVKEEA